LSRENSEKINKSGTLKPIVDKIDRKNSHFSGS
jgi:hypothetical protein